MNIEVIKENKPLVTVVTVTYNLVENKRVKYIKQCLESVHSQGYPHIEHVVIDGASNDGSLLLLKKYEDLGWIKLYSEPDMGIYDAMNKGILKANGKYVNMLNSDDFFHDKDGIQTCVKYLEENNADYTYADTCVIKRSGRKTLWKGDISQLLIGSHYCHQTMFIRTNLLNDMGGFDLSYRVSADSDLMIRLYARKAKPIYVPCCFLTYRYGGYSYHCSNQMRGDHSMSFFRHIGQYIGLSKEDCFQLWQLRFIFEQPYAKQVELISKVPKEFGLEYISRELAVRNPLGGKAPECQKYSLFGFIPIFEIIYRDCCYRYLIFGLLDLLKITVFDGKWKYYLFGFILVLKVKRFLRM